MAKSALISVHLLTKPTVRGTPIRLKPAMTKANMVSGICRPMPARSSRRAEPMR